MQRLAPGKAFILHRHVHIVALTACKACDDDKKEEPKTDSDH
jgi:hypothetical protein